MAGNNITSDTAKEIAELIRRERLPASYAAIVSDHYAPLAAVLARRQTKLARTIVIGVNGPQGSGKSTIAQFLALLLQTENDKRVVQFSLDDFYLAKAQRRRLAEEIHPLLVTRGPPGAHDVKLGASVISRLINARPNDCTRIPRFDKAKDDRLPEDYWRSFKGAPDIIIFEGWCVGACPQPESALAEVVNELERAEDTDGKWRHFVNQCLVETYPALFQPIDILIYLKPPEFECVFKWRQLQERKLGGLSGAAQTMSDSELRRFIMHFERLTRYQMEIMPDRADIVIELDKDQQVIGIAQRLGNKVFP